MDWPGRSVTASDLVVSVSPDDTYFGEKITFHLDGVEAAESDTYVARDPGARRVAIPRSDPEGNTVDLPPDLCQAPRSPETAAELGWSDVLFWQVLCSLAANGRLHASRQAANQAAFCVDKPKAPFKPVFEVATTREDSEVALVPIRRPSLG